MKNNLIAAFLLILVLVTIGCGTPLASKSPSGYSYVLHPIKAHEDAEKHWREARIRRENYIAQHPEFDIGMKNLILSGLVVEGMTKEQALASHGEPYSKEINDSKEIWRYKAEVVTDLIVYFEKDVVIKVE